MNEIRVLACAVLLSAGVSAAVAAGIARYGAPEAPGIATVRLAELAARHAEEVARAGASPEETAAGVRAWAAALEDALGEIAERHRVVLLPARAVAAGAPDVTDAVRLRLAGRLGHPASGAEARR